MKIISKIKIHPLFYFVAVICILTGFFKYFIFLFMIILIHELGHILTALFFDWNIKKIVILPFGGITIFEDKINRSMAEEFLIAIMGPMFQLFLFFIKNKLFFSINLFILLFNLIPIFQLDGSKILNVGLNYLFPFKKIHIISIIISLTNIITIILLLKFNLVLITIFLFLILKTFKEIKYHSYLFNKFLFERYLYNFDFKKSKIIKNEYQMKRDYKHLFFIQNRYQTEKQYLSNLFDNY